MKKIYNTLNIVYFILIIITVILIIYYVNNYYIVKEKFTNNEKCTYLFNNKIVLETCRDNNNVLTKVNTYITNDKTIINIPEDINDVFINDNKTKKCQVSGIQEDNLNIICCNNFEDKSTCKSNSYSNIINKTVLS